MCVCEDFGQSKPYSSTPRILKYLMPLSLKLIFYLMWEPHMAIKLFPYQLSIVCAPWGLTQSCNYYSLVPTTLRQSCNKTYFPVVLEVLCWVWEHILKSQYEKQWITVHCVPKNIILDLIFQNIKTLMWKLTWWKLQPSVLPSSFSYKS
jgi:hypothetical protein